MKRGPASKTKLFILEKNRAVTWLSGKPTTKRRIIRPPKEKAM
jgi:hypothetical protein